MRKFSSYGLVETNHNYYSPREELRKSTIQELIGDHTTQGGTI